MARFDLDAQNLYRIQQAIKNYPKGAEKTINEVLHTEGGALIEARIRQLMPVSGKNWNGKKPAAKHGKSLKQENHNLAVTIRTTSNYHYLYFPDDGTNTYRHVGKNGKPQGFFLSGATQQQTEIIDRCINRLVEKFET